MLYIFMLIKAYIYTNWDYCIINIVYYVKIQSYRVYKHLRLW